MLSWPGHGGRETGPGQMSSDGMSRGHCPVMEMFRGISELSKCRKCPDPHVGLQVFTYSGYDLPHPGLTHTHKHTGFYQVAWK